MGYLGSVKSLKSCKVTLLHILHSAIFLKLITKKLKWMMYFYQVQTMALLTETDLKEHKKFLNQNGTTSHLIMVDA